MKKKLLLQDFIDYIAQHEGLNPDEAESFVRSFFDIVEQGLLEDKIVKIKGLGTFKLVAVSERESVNINTGERFQIEGHSKISFTPDNSMKELINRPFAHFEAVELCEDTDAEEFVEVDNEVKLEFENSDEISEEDDEEFDDTEESKDENTTSEENIISPQPELISSEEPAATATVSLGIEDSTNNGESSQQPESSTESLIDHEQTALTNEMPIEQPIELETHEPINNTQPETAMQENNVDENPQPTTIAPTNLAESENKRETARIRIDSNEEDNETEDSPRNESSVKSNSDTSENVEVSEEEIVVTPPRPITSENSSLNTSNTMGYAYVEVPSRRKVNWWKRGVLTFLFLLLLVMSYFAGYYNVLCPCFSPQPQINTSKSAIPTVLQTAEQEDSLAQSQSSDINIKTSEQTSSTKLSDKTEQAEAQQPEEQVNSEKHGGQEQLTKEKAAQKNSSDQSGKDSQNQTVKTNKGKISNSQKVEQPTIRTHTVKVGDTLYKIARKYYGTEDAIHKIIKYNNLKDADNIQLGMTLKIP